MIELCYIVLLFFYIFTAFIEKNPCVNGPTQFKPMLFKHQVELHIKTIGGCYAQSEYLQLNTFSSYQHVTSMYVSCTCLHGIYSTCPGTKAVTTEAKMFHTVNQIASWIGKTIQSFLFSAFLVQSFPLSCLCNTDCRRDVAIIWCNVIKKDGKSNNARHKVIREVDFICVDDPTAKLTLESLLNLYLP